MSTENARRRVAMLVEDEFEDRDLFATVDLLRAAGVQVEMVAPVAGRSYRGRRGGDVVATLAAGKCSPTQFDAVVIPGGYAPDRIRLRHAMLDLVRGMLSADKPVAAIDHGPQVLISVRAVAERTLTCWPSIAVDVKNAGGRYVDRPVVEDGCLITSRKADDVPHFAAAILKALGSLQPTS